MMLRKTDLARFGFLEMCRRNWIVCESAKKGVHNMESGMKGWVAAEGSKAMAWKPWSLPCAVYREWRIW